MSYRITHRSGLRRQENSAPCCPIETSARPGAAFRGRLRLLALLFVLGACELGIAAPPSALRAETGFPDRPTYTRAPLPGEFERTPSSNAAARSDTVRFGFYEVREDGLKYAVRDGVWSWDHGAADPLEGWTSVDLTANNRDYWRWMTAAIWTAEGNPGLWPQMNASPGIALCGAGEGYADTLSWVKGVGYGNNWCQWLTSPALTYDGTGSVDLSLHYFNETEAGYDYSRVLAISGSLQSPLNGAGFTGEIGIDGAGVITQQTLVRAITNAELGGGTAERDFTIRLEVRSDGAGSDQDGYEGFDAFYGALGVDDVVLDGTNLVPPVARSFTFDDGLQGWTASHCPGAGSFMGVAPVSNYVILDPCGCGLSENILEFHDENQMHPGDLDPVPQHEMGYTCIVDRKSDLGDPAYLDYNRIFAEWDQYSELPMENAVFYRPGWSYYPYENPSVPGLITWSPRVGAATEYYVGSDPVCHTNRIIGTDWGLPADCEQVKFIYEITSSCQAFGIPECSDITNATPLLDNVQIGMVNIANAPAVTFDPGARFQDGFGQGSDGLLSVYDRGNANIALNLRMGSANPAKLGDSLTVGGPPVTPTGTNRWEARIWFRIPRMGPAQGQLWDFLQWQRAITAAKGVDFCTGPNPGFTWGYLDSCEVGTNVAKNRFCTQFRDGPSSGGQYLPADPNFNWGGGGEQAEGNEILPDGVFTPGTKIEYFVTANYICLPGEYYELPDTIGGNYLEFEILPSYRLDAGVSKFPCVLYVKAYPYDSQQIIPHALNVVLNGAEPGDPIPSPTTWDQYDYLDSPSSWRATFYRETGGNSGATLKQLLGYRAILLSTGTNGTGCTVARDWTGLRDWIESLDCESSLSAQGFLADGNNVAEIVNATYPDFLYNKLGAQHTCWRYAEEGCPPGEADNDENFCVRLETVSGAPVAPDVPVDLFGNWCPADFAFDVIGTWGAGVASQDYVKIGTGTPAHYAQVINDQIGGQQKYRSIVNGYSSLCLTARDLDEAPDPVRECPYDDASRVGGVAASLQSSLRWMMNLGDPKAIGLCEPHPGCGSPNTEVPEGAGSALVNRLHPNQPNPLNPRTTIRFSLAAAGDAKLVVYDVTGRTVRTLVDGPQTAGLHEVIWDGQDDGGHLVPSGVYWTRLSTASFQSNRKMVVLK